jgi:hypothetical protein
VNENACWIFRSSADESMTKRKSLSSWFRRTGASKWYKRHRFTEPVFEPYVKAIGQLLLAWNDLHENLSFLFVVAMGGGWVDLPLAVWHATRTDLSKRRLLLAAIQKQTPNITGQWPKLVDEITWIIKVADKLEGARDDSALRR